MAFVSRYLVFSVLCLGFLAGCSEPHSGRWEKCEEAYELSVSSLQSDVTIEADVVWLIQKVLAVAEDSRLRRIVDVWVGERLDHPYRILVEPGSARIELPESPGEGVDKYFYYVQAALGFPEERAARFVADFVEVPNSGYILTHQLASLIWCEETGLTLEFDAAAKKTELLAEIYAEHVEQGHTVCVDLFAERTALLLRYGNPDFEEATEWVGKLVNSQREDGAWPESKAVLEYDGQFATIRVPPSHTTALAMLAIRTYMIDYLEN